MARGVPRSPFDSCSLFITRREEAIEKALQVRLAQIAEERARKRAEARKARDKLAAEVLVLVRQVFAMLDVDDGGTLSGDEIVRGVEEDEEVVKFLINCGNEYLAALLKPKKLEKALIEIDTDGSGEVDLEEWEAAVLAGLEKRLQAMAEDRERRERAAAAADEGAGRVSGDGDGRREWPLPDAEGRRAHGRKEDATAHATRRS